jgi:hypothetical protein
MQGFANHRHAFAHVRFVHGFFAVFSFYRKTCGLATHSFKDGRSMGHCRFDDNLFEVAERIWSEKKLLIRRN